MESVLGRLCKNPVPGTLLPEPSHPTLHPTPEALPSTCKLVGIIFQLESIIIHFFQKQILKISWQEHCSLNTVEKRRGLGLEEFSQMIENIKGAVRESRERTSREQTGFGLQPPTLCLLQDPSLQCQQPASPSLLR